MSSHSQFTPVRARELERKVAKLERALAHSHRETSRLLSELAKQSRDAREARLLVREVDHRAKNSLQLAASMLHLQAAAVEDPSVRLNLETAVQRLHSLAAIHAALYEAGDGQQVPVRAWLDRVGQAMGGNPNVRIEVDAPDLIWPIDRAAPLGLFAGEAIANALKHAFPEDRTGLVVVSLRTDGSKRWRLEVADDGQGDPSSVHEGLGFRLLKAFARQLDGEFELGSSKGGRGLTVAALFALPETDGVPPQ